MISINDIRSSPQKVEETLHTKGYEGSISNIVAIDENFRNITYSLETSRAKKNLVSEEVANAKRNGEQSEDKIKEMRILGDEIKSLETELGELKLKLTSKLEEIPNLPHKSVPIGVDEKDNVIVREWGEKPVFDFKEKTHLELGKALNLIDRARC